ncbi:hypothetical protein R1flu_013598 [Riccia fluitans]|uniref:Uncharacterized protein n=1 Tax=Riccia fluitans TaxID=41844 RepID=A0ABD1YHE4_9MARC
MIRTPPTSLRCPLRLIPKVTSPENRYLTNNQKDNETSTLGNLRSSTINSAMKEDAIRRARETEEQPDVNRSKDDLPSRTRPELFDDEPTKNRSRGKLPCRIQPDLTLSTLRGGEDSSLCIMG